MRPASVIARSAPDRRRLAPRMAIAAIVILISAGAAASMLAAWLLPSERLLMAATHSEAAPLELDPAAADRLYRIVRDCELFGMTDLPIRLLGWAKPAPASSAGVTAALAREAHMQVLEEHGGQWSSRIQLERLNRLADAVASAAGDPPGSYKITLLNSAVVNAFSTADGRIYITRGLVTSSTDDELAVVLAHEMHHIRSGHWVNWWQLELGEDLDEELTENGLAPVQRDAAAALAALGAMTPDSAVSSYDQEFEADAVGAISGRRCGFDPSSIYSALTRLPQMPVTSHPSATHRIERVRPVLEGMEMKHWQAAFDPVQVAVNAVAETMEPEPGGVRAFVSGMDRLAAACLEVLNHVRVLEREMLRSRWLGRGRTEVERRLVGRMAYSGSAVAVVDVGIRTGFGRETAGTAAQVCGRVWMVKLAGVWTPLLAQTVRAAQVAQRVQTTQTAQTAPTTGGFGGSSALRGGNVSGGSAGKPLSGWLTTRDELGQAWRRHKDGSAEQKVLKQAAAWRDTAVTDFAEHLAVYARGRLEQSVQSMESVQSMQSAAQAAAPAAPAAPTIDAEARPAPGTASPATTPRRPPDRTDRSHRGHGLGHVLSGRASAAWPAWDVELVLHSETLATVSFCSAIEAEGLIVASANITLTLTIEDGEWKVVRVSWS